MNIDWRRTAFLNAQPVVVLLAIAAVFVLWARKR